MKILFSPRGNALFLILIAVALFAALSYAITQSGRGGGGGVDREQLSLKAARLANYAALIQQGVTRLMTLNGCTADEINFWGYDAYAGEGPGWTGDPPSIVNNTARADGTCDVFSATGAGVPVMGFDDSYCRSGATQCFFGFLRAPIAGIGLDPVDSNDPSGWEIFFWGYDMDQELCTAVNRALGITYALEATGYGVGHDYVETGTGASRIGSGQGTEFAGKMEGCYCYADGASPECNPYFTVIVR